MSGVVRGSDGVPNALTEPILLPSSGSEDSVEWAGDTNLLVSAYAAKPDERVVPRIVSVDALRGFVMLLMLVDHTRELFYYPMQVSDPMALPATPPTLFFTRLTAHLCAPVFVLLTGEEAE